MMIKFSKKRFNFFFSICFFLVETMAFADLIDDLNAPILPQKPAVSPSPLEDPSQKEEKKDQSEITEDVKSPPKKSGKKNAKEESGKPEDKEIELYGKTLKAYKQKGYMEIIDDVLIKQGDLELMSDKATAFFEKDNKQNKVDKVIATGNVKIKKFNYETKENMRAFAQEAIFYNKKREIHLKGEARLFKGKDKVRGKQIIYNLETGMIEVSEVEGVLQPQAENPAAKRKKK